MEQEVKAVLQEGGIAFKTNSKSFIMTCPRCHKKDKLYIRRSDGRFVCWVCKETEGFQGKPEFALTELCSLPVKDISQRLYGDSKSGASLYLDLDMSQFMDGDDEYIDLGPIMRTYAWPLDFFPIDDPASEKGKLYLEQRGIPVSIAKEYDIRYQPSRLRVIFPVQAKGNLYGWQGRLIQGDKPYYNIESGKFEKPNKALTFKELKRDRALMFTDRLEGLKHCVLTEGPIDALKAHLCGGNVATMGKAVSGSQLSLLRNAGVEKLYLGLDPDAYLEINRVRRIMSDMVCYDLRPPAPYEDLGDMPMEAVKQLFDNAPVLNPAHIVIYLKDFFGVQ